MHQKDKGVVSIYVHIITQICSSCSDHTKNVFQHTEHIFLPLPYRDQVHSRAAGGAGEQCVSDRREHAVSGYEREDGEGTAGYEAFPVTLQGIEYILVKLIQSRHG